MVNLGDEVKDRITGYQGIAVARHSYLQGCDRITVSPPIDKNGKLREEANFDEPQLEVIKAAKVKRTAPRKNPGGPEKHSDTPRSSG